MSRTILNNRDLNYVSNCIKHFKTVQLGIEINASSVWMMSKNFVQLRYFEKKILASGTKRGEKVEKITGSTGDSVLKKHGGIIMEIDTHDATVPCLN